MRRIQVGMKIAEMDLVRHVSMKKTPYKIYVQPKKFAWLAKLAWNVLHKLNALEPFSEKVTTWVYEKPAQKAMTDRILSMQREIAEYCENPRDYVLVMGGEDFQELCGSPSFRHTFVFQTAEIRTPYQRFAGADVYVVPYLEGMAMIPKAVIEARTA